MAGAREDLMVRIWDGAGPGGMVAVLGLLVAGSHGSAGVLHYILCHHTLPVQHQTAIQAMNENKETPCDHRGHVITMGRTKKRDRPH